MAAEAPQSQDVVTQWRASDEAFVEKHFGFLERAARAGFEASGRGALFVDVTTIYDEAVSGKPRPQMSYVTRQQITEREDGKLLPLVETYDPAQEFIGVLCHLQQDIAYRIGRGRRRTPVT